MSNFCQKGIFTAVAYEAILLVWDSFPSEDPALLRGSGELRKEVERTVSKTWAGLKITSHFPQNFILTKPERARLPPHVLPLPCAW